MSSPAPSADRNLLAGIFALQHDFVSREQLIEAMNRWVLQKQTPLEQLLPLAEEDRALLEGMLKRHLAKHHGDVQQSLRSLPVTPEVRHSLGRLPDVAESLHHLPATPPAADDPLRTVAPIPGEGGPRLRFRPMREHAKGGLGVVFVALDEDLGRDVALKEIRPDREPDHPGVRARFLREGEVTGKLEHPGVVPVYALGKYLDGRPYYAMRFVQGESLAHAIERFHAADADPKRDRGERLLALRGLLGRFVAVCNTVAHAHSRGVVHRDLKPANVMLGDFGETLVVDWGLAKVLNSVDSEAAPKTGWLRLSGESSTEATRQGEVFGTPAYMPPEQAVGQAGRVGPASDIWALGAMLYCLLTGRAPYEGGDVVAQAGRCEVIPPRQRKPGVPAALEAVCLMAMVKEPQDRYSTAKELAQEVERWLADEPVSACREPLRERVRRWAKRNRVMVGAAVTMLATGMVALSSGLYAVGREQRRTAEALEQTEANLELARRAVDECFNIAKEHKLFQKPRMEEAKKLLLQAALPFYKEFRSRRPHDSSFLRGEAAQLRSLAYIESVLGKQLKALEAYEQARIIQSRLAEAHPDNASDQDRLAWSHNAVGLVLHDLGRDAESLREHQQARTIWTSLAEAHPEDTDYQEALATNHNNLGWLHYRIGNLSEALDEYNKAREIQTRRVKARPESPEHRHDLARITHNLGLLLHAMGKGEEALSELNRARDIRIKLVQAHPDEVDYRETLVRIQNDYALRLKKMGKYEEALKEHHAARVIMSRLAQSNPELPEYQGLQAMTHANLGDLLREIGRGEEALWELEQATAIYNRLFKNHPQLPRYPEGLAITHANMARLLRAMGNNEGATKELDQARVIYSKLAVSESQSRDYVTERSHINDQLGELLNDMGDYNQAFEIYQQESEATANQANALPREPWHLRRLALAHINLVGLARSRATN